MYFPIKFRIDKKIVFLIFLFFQLSFVCHSQSIDSSNIQSEINKKRLNTVIYGGGTIYVLSMAGFYELWYSDFETTSFHFFNDNREWLYMDKLGHIGTSYQLSKWGKNLFLWTGLPERKALWYGTGISMLFLSSIEVFDGFSSEWGFSVGDIVANSMGAGLFVAQDLLWNEQKMVVKFSYHNSDFPKYRPSLLGKSQLERVLKDYNGQTYWLSTNLKSTVFKEKNFPKWINFAIGYGASGMITANEDDVIIQQENLPQFKRYSQFYFSPDVALTNIKSNSKVINTILNVFEFVKIPLPALEVNTNGKVKFHPIYF